MKEPCVECLVYLVEEGHVVDPVVPVSDVVLQDRPINVCQSKVRA